MLAAMSGGVDSAVAAARAVAAGHEVTGVHLALSRNPASYRSGARGCCTIEDSRDAWRAADVLGIPFYVWDMSEEFAAEVVDDFLAEYAGGRTPNPCLRCNERIKFAAVLDRARALGFDAVCTGHYARLVDGPAGRELHRAGDVAKDQSYVLGVLDAEQLAGCLFPLGESTKAAVRAEAAALGLSVAAKPDSHDICFIPSGDTAGFLRSRLGEAPGAVVDATTGEVLGQHHGAFAYTVGQRRGVGLGRPASDGARRYVVDVDVASRRVLVGPQAMLETRVLQASRARWSNQPLVGSASLGVQIRAHGEEVPAVVDAAADGQGFLARLTDPLRGVAPGQSAVLYDGTRVVGSGTIVRGAA
ncbi:MAG TPA: tRNA 2-thiouridine(34) synthase MnmA [Candidatus Nanopelagicales bacterium]